jgi:hypothetical protein
MWRVFLVVALLLTSGLASPCTVSPPKTEEEARQREQRAASRAAKEEAEIKAALERIAREEKRALKGAKTKEQEDEIRKRAKEKEEEFYQRIAVRQAAEDRCGK